MEVNFAPRNLNWQPLIGRIFHLNFGDYDDKYFFWMQEPDESKDDQVMKQVNDIINFDETAQPVPVAST